MTNRKQTHLYNVFRSPPIVKSCFILSHYKSKVNVSYKNFEFERRSLIFLTFFLFRPQSVLIFTFQITTFTIKRSISRLLKSLNVLNSYPSKPSVLIWHVLIKTSNCFSLSLFPFFNFLKKLVSRKKN